MKASRPLLAAVLILLIIAFFALGLADYLSFGYLKSQHAAITGYFHTHPLRLALIYGAIYIAVTGLSLPGATVLTLAGGAIFGVWWGLLIVSFASSIGATLAFLAARFLFRDTVQQRVGDSLGAVNRGIERDGALYLLALRLVPLFPFFFVNLVMGLTPIGLTTFYTVSQLGMLPGTWVFVNAGTQLAQLKSANELLSPSLLTAFVLLGLFPLLAKRVISVIKSRRALRGYPRPTRFDRNLIVIGAGSAGLVSAYIAAAVRAKVTLIEKNKMGGECLNTGCVPSKALIRSARFVAQISCAEELGIRRASAEIHFADIMARVQRTIATVAPHDSVERYTRLGVDCMHGEARVVSPWAVEINGRTLTTRGIVIATGSHPQIPPLPGLDHIDYLTSDSVWQLRELPKRLLVLGGGPIGCELAQSFARLGSRVTLVQRADRLLNREDPEFSAMVMDRFNDEAVDVRVGYRAVEFLQSSNGTALVCEYGGTRVTLEFDRVLLALGRSANISGYGLEALGIHANEHGKLDVDDYLQTRIPTIYACGDVAGPYLFTHAAAHQAWYATVNALFGIFRRFQADYSVIPWCTFTDPEVARVGLNEQEARARNIPYEVTTFDIDDLDRAIADEEAYGRVKVLTVPGKDRILGVTIAGAHAGDTIAEFVSAMRHGIGLNKILQTIHIYPTFAEANKYVAGAWKRAHAPQQLLRLLARYHSWRRK
ncbi:MAG: FAD-dependent oxidoreductase [Gammaproteobacteria bacterium]|nr:FAD-dependent oxidoreductase [Gammaproteobacteria bacterium]